MANVDPLANSAPVNVATLSRPMSPRCRNAPSDLVSTDVKFNYITDTRESIDLDPQTARGGPEHHNPIKTIEIIWNTVENS
jgi:hypothetical protein